MTSFSGTGVSVLLMGTGTYSVGTGESRLPSIPAVHDTLHDLNNVLVQQCGVSPGAIRVVEDPETSQDMGLAIVAAAERASELLVMYYIGHGLVSDGGQLFLAGVQTDQENLKLPFTALPYNDVRDVLMTQRTTVVVVLDCCFSGRAVGALGSSAALDSELTRYDGGFVLAAAGRDQVALALPGDRHTAFTGALIRLLQQGDPDGPEQITLDAAARYLVRTLPARGLPRPHRMGSAHTGELVLAPNSAFRPNDARKLVDVADTAPSYQICPYPGLTAFQESDAPWFFGRRQLIGKLIHTVAAGSISDRCTAVLGASGAGKSSLLRAGLLPAIARGELPVPGSSRWPSAVITPTATPLRSLIDGLAMAGGWDSDTMWARTARDPARLVDAMHTLVAERTNGDQYGGRLVLVVDQLEELFTTCQDSQERARFITTLAAAVESGDREPAALVIFGLRSDHYGSLAEYDELRSALQDGQVLVGAMTSEELTDAIRRPAEAVGLSVEAGLVELLVRDVGTAETTMRQEATLPLLAHALRQTWEHRKIRTLTVDGYLTTGGVSGSLAKTAEEVYTGLDTTARRTAEHLLIRLIHIGETTRDTRRRLEVPVLCAGLPEADHVLDALTAARLVTIDGTVAQITHEALISGWDRLRLALDTDRRRLVESQKLDAEADQWERANRDPSFLLRGSRLGAARELFEKSGGLANLTPPAHALLNESVARQRAAKRGARQRSMLARSLGAITLVLVVLTVTAGVWGMSAHRAEMARLRVAASMQAAAASMALQTTQPSDAMLLAVAAWRIAPTTQARGALLTTQSQPFAGSLPDRGGRSDPVLALAMHATTGLLAVARRQSIELWDVAQRTLVAERPTYTDGTQLAFTSDGAFLLGVGVTGTRIWDVRRGIKNHGPLPESVLGLSGFTTSPDDGSIAVSSDNAIHWIDPASRTVTRTLPVGVGRLIHMTYTAGGQSLIAVTAENPRIVVLDATTGAVKAATTTPTPDISLLAVQPSGSILATINSDGVVQLWDLSTATLITTLAGHGAAVTAVAFSPDGRQLATAGLDRTVRLWDVHTWQQVGDPLGRVPGQVSAMMFGPDNDTLITAGAGVDIWNVKHRPIAAHAAPINAVAFQRGGRRIATAGDDGVVNLWDVARQTPAGTLAGHTASVRAVTFNSQGTQLITAGTDNTIRTWDVGTGSQVGPTLEGQPGVQTIAVSPDKSILAAADDGTVVRLWDSDRATTRDLDLPGNLGDGPYKISISQNGSRLTVTGRDLTLAYRLPSGSQLGEPQAVHAPPSAAPAVWATDGSTEATIRDDQFVRLWDKRNRLQAILFGHRDIVLDAAFSDDRHTLATVSRDGTLMIWDTNPDRVAIEVCQSLHTELTPEEWTRYITDLPYQPICGSR